MLPAALLLSLFLGLVAQEFIPPVPWLNGARVMLMPVALFYSALALPYPLVLAFSVVAGCMWDLMIVRPSDSSVELSLGWSIVSLALICSLVHGLRPMFLRGRWEVHCLASGLGVSAFVLIEYVMISFHLQSFQLEPSVWWRVGGAGVLAMLLSPPVYYAFLPLLRRAAHPLMERRASPYRT